MPSKSLKIDSLEFDLENPRITLASDQRDAMQKIIKEQKGKLINLAEDVAEKGFSPMDRCLILRAQGAGNATSGVARGRMRRETCDRRVGDGRQCCRIIRKSRCDPGLLGGGESGAQARSRRNASADEVRGLERENRRAPTRRQGCERMP